MAQKLLLALACVLPQQATAPLGGRRGIEWATSGSHSLEPFLLGSNPQHWANTTKPVSDITTGVLQCCAGLGATASPSASLRLCSPLPAAYYCLVSYTSIQGPSPRR